MKKLIFLLLTAVILTGFVSATEIAYPPWDISLDAALSELGVDGPAVTSDTVLVDVSLYADQLAAGNIILITKRPRYAAQRKLTN